MRKLFRGWKRRFECWRLRREVDRAARRRGMDKELECFLAVLRCVADVLEAVGDEDDICEKDVKD